jgi:hypothetical protein
VYRNWLFLTGTYRPSADLMMDMIDILNSTVYAYNPAGGIVWDIAFEPLAANLLTGSEQGKNLFGLKPQDNGFGKSKYKTVCV